MTRDFTTLKQSDPNIVGTWDYSEHLYLAGVKIIGQLVEKNINHENTENVKEQQEDGSVMDKNAEIHLQVATSTGQSS